VGFTVPAVLIAAEDVSRGKPAPDGYVMAARRLAVEATDCVVIEDTPAGIAAGNAAGATVIAVATTFPAHALADAAVVVHSLSHIQAATGDGHVQLSITEQVHDAREAQPSPASPREPTAAE
jgi:sugar-phosphatase